VSGGRRWTRCFIIYFFVIFIFFQVFSPLQENKRDETFEYNKTRSYERHQFTYKVPKEVEEINEVVEHVFVTGSELDC